MARKSIRERIKERRAENDAANAGNIPVGEEMPQPALPEQENTESRQPATVDSPADDTVQPDAENTTGPQTAPDGTTRNTPVIGSRLLENLRLSGNTNPGSAARGIYGTLKLNAQPAPGQSGEEDERIKSFREFTEENPEEFLINFAKRNPEPDITEELNFIKSGDYTVPAEALNYFGKELDKYLDSRNIPAEDKERIKKKIRRTRIADALMKTANIIGQTVAVSNGGTPVAMDTVPVLQRLKDRTEKKQKKWEQEMMKAAERDRETNVKLYSDYLDRMMKQEEWRNRMKLKGFRADSEKGRLDKQLAFKREELDAKKEMNAENNKTRKYVANTRASSGGSNKTIRVPVNRKEYFLSDKEVEHVTGYLINDYLNEFRESANTEAAQLYDPNEDKLLYDMERENIYQNKIKDFYKQLSGKTDETKLGILAEENPGKAEYYIKQYLSTGPVQEEEPMYYSPDDMIMPFE